MYRLALLLVMTFAIVACDKPPAPAAPAQKITVSFTYQPQSTLVHVALAKGFFRDEGLEVQPELRSYGKAALQAVIDGQADIATAAETPIMFAILNGADIRVLANIVASNTNNGIVARRDAGIVNARDLKGKRIGYAPGTTSDFFLSSLLAANGIPRTEIREVGLKPDEMLEAIQAKKVDAVSIWNYPLSQIAQALGANGLTIYDKEIYTETFNLVARQDFIARNPEAIRRYLRALFKAEEFARNSPDEAQRIMVEATRIDPDLIRESWDSFQFRVGLDKVLLITLEDETRWAMSNQLTDRTQMPDYLSYLYFDALEAVRPDAIRIER